MKVHNVVLLLLLDFYAQHNDLKHRNADMMNVKRLSGSVQFNCFFLMPVVDTFPSMLREDLEIAFERDIDHVFDVAHVRRTFFQQKQDLELELSRVC